MKILSKRLTAYGVPALLLMLVAISGTASARDQFDGLKCGTDIPKALIGKHSSNEPTAAIAERHKDLGLKDLGGTEISDRLFLSSWQVCGKEYELLLDTKTNVIRDVIAFPEHSAKAPMFVGKCEAKGRPAPAMMVAVLNNAEGADARDEKSAKKLLNATAAWKVDEAKAKFVQQATEGLRCPLGGAVTSDGGP